MAASSAALQRACRESDVPAQFTPVINVIYAFQPSMKMLICINSLII